MASLTLSSALSSMEVMLDALMQRGIGKPEDKPMESEPPALPTRPTMRGRPPSLNRPGGPVPWIPRPPPSMPPPIQEKEEKCAVNEELERRAVTAEEAARQKDEEMRQKEEVITTLRNQVENYESRLSEYEVRMKSVEEELHKQIATLQMAQSAAESAAQSAAESAAQSSAAQSATVTAMARHEKELSDSEVPAQPQSPLAMKDEQPQICEPIAIVEETRTDPVNRQTAELRQESQMFEQGMKDAIEAMSSVKTIEELKNLEGKYIAWKKEYEARLRKTKAELKKLARSEKGRAGGSRRCSWFKIKAPKCKTPKCCTFKLPSLGCKKLASLPSFSCCFRRRS